MPTAITIDHEDLRVGSYYWARSHGSDETEIVQVSDIFGSAREYWTVATIGSDQHRNLKEFDFLIRLLKP
ncbi:hypothetical protein [Neorhizobium alkalisoli]|uniref:hypothetical protein n=1 Tax=Neorhizobium alkalisoli TaxID=528178 RepID=UPI001FEFB6E1|nr:hypothetical protein [Neorhizobium alkalisoli]